MDWPTADRALVVPLVCDRTSRAFASVSILGLSEKQGHLRLSAPLFQTQNELKLIEIVVGLLEDQTMNPYKGSVPVERIQNVVRWVCPEFLVLS